MSSTRPPRPVAVNDQPPGRPLMAADVLTAGEVAALLPVPRSTVEDWARRGVIPRGRWADVGSTCARAPNAAPRRGAPDVESRARLVPGVSLPTETSS